MSSNKTGISGVPSDAADAGGGRGGVRHARGHLRTALHAALHTALRRAHTTPCVVQTFIKTSGFDTMCSANIYKNKWFRP